MRIYILALDEPFYAHKILTPLLKAFECVGMGRMEPVFQWKRAMASLITMGPQKCAQATFPRIFTGERLFPVEKIISRTAPGIPLRTIRQVNSEEHREWVRSLRPDAMVVLNCMEIIRPPLLQILPKGVVNVHFGLLPKYRGIMPAYHALMNGEGSFGISAYFMDEGLDNGPILAQTVVPISATDGLEDLYEKGFKRAGPFLVETLNNWERGTLLPVPNDPAGASYFGYPTCRSLARYARRRLRQKLSSRSESHPSHI